MDKARELARAKRTATLWLAGAGGMFFITLVMQHQSAFLAQHSALNLIRMASEAALVGGLADWFAVSALFRPVPRQFPGNTRSVGHSGFMAISTQPLDHCFLNLIGQSPPLSRPLGDKKRRQIQNQPGDVFICLGPRHTRARKQKHGANKTSKNEFYGFHGFVSIGIHIKLGELTCLRG